jgi:hypothetical protein
MLYFLSEQRIPQTSFLYEIPNEETDESELIHNNYNKKSGSNTGGDANTEGNNTSLEMEWQILRKKRKFSAPYK